MRNFCNVSISEVLAFFLGFALAFMIAAIITFNKVEMNYALPDSENWDSLVYVTKHYDTVCFRWLRPEDYGVTFYINDVKQEP